MGAGGGWSGSAAAVESEERKRGTKERGRHTYTGCAVDREISASRGNGTELQRACAANNCRAD